MNAPEIQVPRKTIHSLVATVVVQDSIGGMAFQRVQAAEKPTASQHWLPRQKWQSYFLTGPNVMTAASR